MADDAIGLEITDDAAGPIQHRLTGKIHGIPRIPAHERVEPRLRIEGEPPRVRIGAGDHRRLLLGTQSRQPVAPRPHGDRIPHQTQALAGDGGVSASDAFLQLDQQAAIEIGRDGMTTGDDDRRHGGEGLPRRPWCGPGTCRVEAALPQSVRLGRLGDHFLQASSIPVQTEAASDVIKVRLKLVPKARELLWRMARPAHRRSFQQVVGDIPANRRAQMRRHRLAPPTHHRTLAVAGIEQIRPRQVADGRGRTLQHPEISQCV